MLENVNLLLLAVLSLALLLIGPHMRPNRQFHALISQGDVGQGPIATPPPASQEGWRIDIEHLQARLGQATASKALLEQDVARLEREKADLEVKYLARVKSAEEKKQKIEAWRRKKVGTRKGLSEQAAEILAEQDKWLPHARDAGVARGKRGKKINGRGGGRHRPEKIHYEKHVWPTKCPHCGADLSRARAKKPYWHVVTDIENLQDDPKDNKILVLRNVKMYHHGRWCRQCKKWVYHDLGALKWARYGLNFVIYVISKRIATRMPFDLIIADLVNQFGLPLTLSAPSIVGWFIQYEDVLADVSTQLKEIAARQDFTHLDETGLPLRGENWWVWVVCNAHFTLLFESRTRGHAAIADLASKLKGPAVTDCWGAYGKMEQDQQKCLGHLASSVNEVLVARQKENARIERELARAKVSLPLRGMLSMPSSSLGQSLPVQPSPVRPSPVRPSPIQPSPIQPSSVQPLSDQPTPPEKKKRGRPRKPSGLSLDDLTRMEAVAQENKRTIQQATRLREFIGGAWKEGSPLYFGAPNGTRMPQDQAEQQLANLVDSMRGEGPPDQDLRRILDRCENFRGQWFTYLSYPGMPPDNNQAERDLRPWAVQRKVSGGFQSEHVVHSYLTYKSLFATCQKNDKDFQKLLELLLSRQKVDLLDFFFTEGTSPAASAPVSQ